MNNEETPRQAEKNLAETHGFSVEPDVRGCGWHVFSKGKVRIWCVRFWARAELIDDRFRNHQAFEELEDALNDDGGLAYGPDSSPHQSSTTVPFALRNPLS